LRYENQEESVEKLLENETQLTESRKMIRRILVATDGSADASEAVAAGVELAASEGAEVFFLHVTDPVEYRHSRGVPARPIPRRQESSGDPALHEAARAAAERDVDHQCELIAGDVVDTIVELASAIEADLVVVGARDRKLPLGGVSRSVLRRTDRPVLIAKRRKDHRLAA
jgi:nucleotide-binding universal stress UspA family protein